MTKNILILTSITAAALVGLGFLTLEATHTLAGPAAQSGTPELISYQGYLTDDAGQPISGTVYLQFGLYDAPSGGNPLWERPRARSPWRTATLPYCWAALTL